MPTSPCRLPKPAALARRSRGRLAPEPVIARGDSSDVLNPSVVRFQGAYWNFYSEFDGTDVAHRRRDFLRRTRLDETRPRAFARRLGRIFHRRERIRARWSDDEILYWYEAGDPLRIALARSRDGKNWTRQGEPVVPARTARQFRRAGGRRSVRHPRGRRTSICSIWARTAPAARAWASRVPPTASRGRSCAPIRFSNPARPERSTKTAWANPPCGPQAASGGCSTPAATRRNSAAWVWRIPPTVSAGNASRTSSYPDRIHGTAR